VNTSLRYPIAYKFICGFTDNFPARKLFLIFYYIFHVCIILYSTIKIGAPGPRATGTALLMDVVYIDVIGTNMGGPVLMYIYYFFASSLNGHLAVTLVQKFYALPTCSAARGYLCQEAQKCLKI
jgi:hypothetical protein